MFQETITCDCCKKALQPRAPYVSFSVHLVREASRGPLDPPEVCQTCSRLETADLPCTDEDGHTYPSDRYRARNKRRRGSVSGESVDICTSCFSERSIELFNKLLPSASPV